MIRVRVTTSLATMSYCRYRARRPRTPVSALASSLPMTIVTCANMSARLLAEDYEVETAPDGQAALNAARERPPHLILSDVMMPVMDGFQLLEAIRADEHTRRIPVVLLSARSGEESRVEGMDAGADDT